MTQIPANIPDLGAPKGFTPGVLVLESALVKLDPTPMGVPYAPPLIPIDPAVEGLVRSRTVVRSDAGHVEILTLRYENPNEQVLRLAWEKKAVAEAEDAAEAEDREATPRWLPCPDVDVSD